VHHQAAEKHDHGEARRLLSARQRVSALACSTVSYQDRVTGA